MSGSTISDNQATNEEDSGGVGGGIYNLSLLTAADSTISGNTATAAGGTNEGGGIFDSGGSVTQPDGRPLPGDGPTRRPPSPGQAL
jgi:hypothetical protein